MKLPLTYFVCTTCILHLKIHTHFLKVLKILFTIASTNTWPHIKHKHTIFTIFIWVWSSYIRLPAPASFWPWKFNAQNYKWGSSYRIQKELNWRSVPTQLWKHLKLPVSGTYLTVMITYNLPGFVVFPDLASFNVDSQWFGCSKENTS